MKKVFFVFIFVFCQLWLSAAAPRPANTVRFMDYNVWNGIWSDQYHNYDRFVTWMNGQSPDVLALCEAATHKDREQKRIPKEPGKRYLPDNLPELALRWGHPYTAVGPYQDNYPVAITSRYPIEVKQLIGEGLCHGALHVKIRGVNYVVVHTWPLGGSKKDRGDGRGDEERYDELKIVIDKTIANPEYKNEKYWVLTGDLNSRSALDDAHYKSVGLKYNYDAMDLVLEHFDGNDVMWKFNGGRYISSLPSGFARIDYIYANDAVYDRVCAAQTILDDYTRVASDHLPVTMEFEDVVEDDDSYSEENICIIPKPVSVERLKGKFRWSEKTFVEVKDEALLSPARIFAGYMEPVFGYVPQVSLAEDLKTMSSSGRTKPSKKSSSKSLTLSVDKGLEKEEYVLEIRPGGIELCGGSPHGVFHGLQTLRQVMDSDGARCMTVRDKPCFGYRGTMLDVSRHFFSVEDVKTFIDILSMHKMNTFHWHLTEDQGWRIEIKKYPELTRKGSVRKETIIGINNPQNPVCDGVGYGGFYTQDEVREIVKYASDRFITVIPEIEMPGHGLGALSSYPWLGCTGGPYSVWTIWGISKDVYCAGKETTFEFIENVLSEVIDLFPSEYIHIGGDECPKDRWKECALCQQRIEDENLADEYELQSYFMQRVGKWLDERGRKIIGWDELLDGGISNTATLMVWRDAYNAAKAAWKGHDVILAPKWYCYMDYSQTSDPKAMEPLCSPRYIPVEQAYKLDPYDKISPAYRHHILGVQANVWTEYIPDIKSVQYKLLPRLAAISEVGWAADRKDFKDFSLRAKALLPKLYRRNGYTYAPYFFMGTDIYNSYNK